MRAGCSREERLRDPAHGSYVHLKSQELHEALMNAHETIGYEVEEKFRLRGEVPASDANAQTVVLFTDQLAAMSNQHQEAQAAAFNAERAMLAEWDAGQLRG